MTICKAQGQMFDKIGLYLSPLVFSHGQLCGASTKVRRLSAITVKWRILAAKVNSVPVTISTLSMWILKKFSHVKNKLNYEIKEEALPQITYVLQNHISEFSLVCSEMNTRRRYWEKQNFGFIRIDAPQKQYLTKRLNFAETLFCVLHLLWNLLLNKAAVRRYRYPLQADRWHCCRSCSRSSR